MSLLTSAGAVPYTRNRTLPGTRYAAAAFTLARDASCYGERTPPSEERHMIRRILAQCTVSDIARAEQWHSLLFDRAPDLRPMPGLIEWHPGDTFGLQVWSEPERAGQSTVVLDETDLDAAAARLTASGIAHDGPVPGGGGRILLLSDPDGNRVVITGQ